MQAICREAGIQDGLGKFEKLRTLAAALRDCAFVFVVIAGADTDPLWWEEVRDSVEFCSKDSVSAPLCVVVLDDRYGVLLEPSYDLTFGWPSGTVLADAERDDLVMWQAYLHQRIAWEAAGNLGLALELDDRLASLRPDDDESFEQRLSEFAADRLARQSNASKLKEYVCKTGAQRESPDIDRAHDEFVAAGLLWRPPRSMTERVVPWASRGLLASADVNGNPWALRANLVCGPLAAELLAICLQGESKIRVDLTRRGLTKNVSQETLENFERFRSGFDRVVYYPEAHPSPPKRNEDAWGFAGLGELLKASRLGAVPESYWSMLHLRNAIAHGHYVTWEHVKLARLVMRALRH